MRTDTGPTALGIASATVPDDDPDLLQSTIMIVDDEPTTLDVLQAFLEEAGYRHVMTTEHSTRVVDLLKSKKPDVLLTDINMPEVTGFDILAAMRAHDDLRHIPAIVLTSADDPETKLKALQLGAADFLAKPVDPSELALRLRNTLAAKAYQNHLKYYDALTGLPNRRMFMDRLEMALRRAHRNHKDGAILNVNLDRFQHINDTLGHRVGDTLLIEVSQRLENSIRHSDSLGRLARGADQANLSRIGGDEFTLLLADITLPIHAAQVARRIMDGLGEPFVVENHELFLTTSIGIAVFPQDGDDLETLLKHVDIATHHAKRQGGNTHAFYSRDMNDKALERLHMENQLRKALERNEMQLAYQPKVDVKTGQIVAAEALMRWRHPELGVVSPAAFIPLAEETGLIVDLGEWALQEACRQNKAWHALGQPLSIAVNVSSQQFKQPNFKRTIYRALANSGLAPQYLTLELTESLIMENASENVDLLHEVKSMGIKLSIDDFGTGYSSLSYLTQFPLDELKVDRSFVSPIQAATDNAPVVTTIITMAHSLGLTVVAEGVETERQLTFLQARGCDVYQGYLFSKPLSGEDFTALLTGVSQNRHPSGEKRVQSTPKTLNAT